MFGSTEPFADVRAELVAALTHPVRWRETFTALHEAGARRFVEVGPGNVLSGLVKRIDRSAKTISVGSPAAIDKLEETLASG